MNPFESIIRGMVQDRINRGKVEVSVSIQDAGERPKTFTINECIKKTNSRIARSRRIL